MNSQISDDIIYTDKNHNYSHSEYDKSVQALSATARHFEFSMREVGIKSYVSQNFYEKYNYFVEQYNEDQNRIMTKLICLVFKTMPCACCYCVWAGLSVGFGISVLTFFYNFFRFMTLIGIVYNLIVNKNKVPNPFKRMIYCKGLKDANAYYRITTDIYDHKIQELGVSIDSFHFALSQVQSSTQS